VVDVALDQDLCSHEYYVPEYCAAKHRARRWVFGPIETPDMSVAFREKYAQAREPEGGVLHDDDLPFPQGQCGRGAEAR
jgi:hypothetical protein